MMFSNKNLYKHRIPCTNKCLGIITYRVFERGTLKCCTRNKVSVYNPENKWVINGSYL